MRLKIAARHSDLARLQAYRVGDALKGAAQPGQEIDYNFRASLGDMNLNDPLWKMPEKGVFTEDFLGDLITGKADLVVHSWKDLPTEARPQTVIAGTLKRADTRDLLLFRKDRFAPAKQNGIIRVLTSSPRRAYNLAPFLKSHLPFNVQEVRFENVRGNIPTRLKKLLSQDVEALVVAKAALDRLLSAPEAEFGEVQSVIRDVLSQTEFMVLPLSVNPTAAAQGALAVEISRERPDLREKLQSINCPDTFDAVVEERRILASYGGGCHQKIGVSVVKRPFGTITYLKGLTDAGEVLDSVRFEAAGAEPKSASNANAIFPRADEEVNFFERETIGREGWGWAESESFLWVARETAWPKDFRAKDGAYVWCAGLRTWEKLASRGIWVHGSAEGLGEEEPTRIETLVEASCPSQEGTPAWVKLTHQDSFGSSEAVQYRICATYKLKPKSVHPDLKGRTHFFWMSGSSFDRAVSLFPEIRKAHHACGPGLTYHHLRKQLGPEAQISVHLSVDDWRKRVCS